MKLTVTESVSLDGVMQGLGGPDEDRRGGFERGGWQIPLSDEEVGAFLNDVYARADAFLFGRRTYEIFAGSWGLMKDPSQSPIGQALHSRRKYVASSTLTEPRWADTTVLFADTGPDVALDLVDTRITPDGVTIQVFRPSGRPEYATSTAKASWRQS
jgi:dihydrofolate reductase